MNEEYWPKIDDERPETGGEKDEREIAEFLAWLLDDGDTEPPASSMPDGEA